MSVGNRARGVFLTGVLPSIEKEVSILPEYMFAGSLDQLSSEAGHSHRWMVEQIPRS